MLVISPSKARLANAWKLHVEVFYSPPLLRAIPRILIALNVVNILLLGTGVTFSILVLNPGPGLAFAEWILIPLLALLLSTLDAFLRYRRTLTPLHAVVSSTITSVLWIAYGFFGFLSMYATPVWAIIAAPGLVASLAYLIVAIVACRRENEERGGDGKKDVELGRRATGKGKGWNRLRREPEAGGARG